ncbi:MAG TPA: ATP-binding protein [Methylomirabilota bacterium]
MPLVTALPEAVFAVDVEGRVTFWNPAAERLLEAKANTVLGQAFHDLDVSARIPGLRATMDRVGSQRQAVEIHDAELSGREGGVQTVSAIIAPLADDEGRPAGVAVALRDETESAGMRAQHAVLSDELRATSEMMESTHETLIVTIEELRTANEELALRVAELEAAQEADRHKNEFLAMLAHELRNPLAAIASAMRVFRHDASPVPDLQRAHEIVERQIKHQARLLDDLLDVSRITRGKVELRRSRLDLAVLVNEVVEGLRDRFDSRQVRLLVDVPSAPLPVHADPTRLTQIIGNLLSNAAKFTPAGGSVHVSLSMAGGEAILRVRDTGVGIPPDMLPRIFDLFTQVKASLARSEGGLGIGLTLVRTLVQLHGGSVSAYSAGVGEGSEFVVQLPLASVVDVSAVPAPALRALARTMLVVEDNDDAREMLRTSLELEGHRVDTAADGVSGLELALKNQPEIALIDIGLPGLDGYEVARRIRRELGQRMTLIALTGYGQLDDRRRTTQAGFDTHLVKPVDPDELARILAAVPPRAA